MEQGCDRRSAPSDRAQRLVSRLEYAALIAKGASLGPMAGAAYLIALLFGAVMVVGTVRALIWDGLPAAISCVLSGCLFTMIPYAIGRMLMREARQIEEVRSITARAVEALPEGQSLVRASAAGDDAAAALLRAAQPGGDAAVAELLRSQAGDDPAADRRRGRLGIAGEAHGSHMRAVERPTSVDAASRPGSTAEAPWVIAAVVALIPLRMCATAFAYLAGAITLVYAPGILVTYGVVRGLTFVALGAAVAVITIGIGELAREKTEEVCRTEANSGSGLEAPGDGASLLRALAPCAVPPAGTLLRAVNEEADARPDQLLRPTTGDRPPTS